MRETVSRSAFLVALASLSAVSLRAPAWASELATHGYYADFMLTLAGPETVAAGTRFWTHAVVHSLGPDTAHQVNLTVRGDEELRLLESDTCARVGAQAVRCGLSEMPGGSEALRDLQVDAHQDARGVRVISGLVASELSPSENYPGLEVDAIAVQLVGAHAAGISLVDERPQVDAEQWLTWTFLVDNVGPSSLLSGRIQLAAAPGSLLSCRPFDGAACSAQATGNIYLPVDGRLEIDVTVPAIDTRIGATHVALTLLRDEGSDIGGRPSVASAAFEFPVFSDSFGD